MIRHNWVKRDKKGEKKSQRIDGIIRKHNILYLNPNIWAIALNISGQYPPVKKQRLSDSKANKSKIKSYAIYTRCF